MVTFNDRVTLHLNGEAATAYHVPHAHTDGDSIVHFPQSEVIHMGDIFFNGLSYNPSDNLLLYTFSEMVKGYDSAGVQKIFLIIIRLSIRMYHFHDARIFFQLCNSGNEYRTS